MGYHKPGYFLRINISYQAYFVELPIRMLEIFPRISFFSIKKKEKERKVWFCQLFLNIKAVLKIRQ